MEALGSNPNGNANIDFTHSNGWALLAKSSDYAPLLRQK